MSYDDFKHRWEGVVETKCVECSAFLEVFESEFYSDFPLLCTECGDYELPELEGKEEQHDGSFWYYENVNLLPDEGKYHGKAIDL